MAYGERMLRGIAPFAIVLASLTLASAAIAEPVKVAIKPSEPFVIEWSEDEWGGLSVALWEHVANELDIEFEYVETDLDGLLDGVADGTYAAGVGALTLTGERERRIDFTHPFYRAGLGIAVSYDLGRTSVVSTVLGVFSRGFAFAVGALTVLLAAVGVIVWILERKRNPEQFGGGVAQGIASGFWFSAVTMTTVGYGDKAPRTAAGRLVVLVWMFASIILISTFTGAIASALTADRLTGEVAGPADLPFVTVGALEDAASLERLADRGVRPVLFETEEAGLDAVASGEITAFVHDRPLLAWLIDQGYVGSLRLLDVGFDPQPYALALPPGSPDREEVNRVLLAFTEGREWREIVAETLGQ
jgi:polar amino acid transport system substrate-binding protein